MKKETKDLLQLALLILVVAFCIFSDLRDISNRREHESTQTELIDSLRKEIIELKESQNTYIENIAEELIALKKENKQNEYIIQYNFKLHIWKDNNKNDFMYNIRIQELLKLYNGKISSLPFDTLTLGERKFGFKYDHIKLNKYPLRLK